MSDRPTPDDPFAEGDPEAAEREARRREREARRRERQERDRGERNRRSLADRVSGALGPREGSDQQAGGGEPPRPAAPAPPPRSEPAPRQPPPPARREPPAERADIPEPEPLPPAERRAPAPIAAAPAGAGSGPDRRTVLGRRLLAGGAVLGVLAVLFLLLRAVDGGEQPAPVAVEEPVKTIDVLVPEGLTVEQIADVAKEAKLKGSYTKAVEQARKDFPLQRYDAADAPSLEGFLFPATYELEKGARSKDLVAKQLEAFRQNFDGVDLKRAKQKNLDAYDVLTIASMVEEEIQVPEERPLAAAVIYNRLSAGDTLGIDATLRYELGNYDQQLRQSELDAATPYNTRLTPGLPPTPIANPGLASIEAAANPKRSDVYYFVVKPGTCGEHVFTADESEFAAAQARYQEALAEEGGSPTDCS